MELFSISFVILILKITFCVLPGVFGVFLIVSSRDTKRRIRSRVCNQLFGANDAIRTHKFSRFLYVLGALSILCSIVASWVFILRTYI